MKTTWIDPFEILAKQVEEMQCDTRWEPLITQYWTHLYNHAPNNQLKDAYYSKLQGAWAAQAAAA